MNVVRTAFVLIAALTASGCSYAFSRPPRRPPPNSGFGPPLCEPMFTPPFVDTLEAAGVAALSATALVSGTRGGGDAYFTISGALLATSAVFAMSAAYGFRQTNACRELHAEQAATMSTSPLRAEPPPIEVEQHVDADDNQIDVHTTIRRVPPR
jgi:hypothetical protein